MDNLLLKLTNKMAEIGRGDRDSAVALRENLTDAIVNYVLRRPFKKIIKFMFMGSEDLEFSNLTLKHLEKALRKHRKTRPFEFSRIMIDSFIKAMHVKLAKFIFHPDWVPEFGFELIYLKVEFKKLFKCPVVSDSAVKRIISEKLDSDSDSND